MTGLAASALVGLEAQTATVPNTYLELKTWRLHNTAEQQESRLAEFLSKRVGSCAVEKRSKLAGAFGNVIGPDGPYYITLTQYASLASMQESLTKLADDAEYGSAVEKLGSGTGLPFVRVESSLLRSFDAMREPAISAGENKRPVFSNSVLTSLRPSPP